MYYPILPVTGTRFPQGHILYQIILLMLLLSYEFNHKYIFERLRTIYLSIDIQYFPE